MKRSNTSLSFILFRISCLSAKNTATTAPWLQSGNKAIELLSNDFVQFDLELRMAAQIIKSTNLFTQVMTIYCIPLLSKISFPHREERAEDNVDTTSSLPRHLYSNTHINIYLQNHTHQCLPRHLYRNTPINIYLISRELTDTTNIQKTRGANQVSLQQKMNDKRSQLGKPQRMHTQ